MAASRGLSLARPAWGRGVEGAAGHLCLSCPSVLLPLLLMLLFSSDLWKEGLHRGMCVALCPKALVPLGWREEGARPLGRAGGGTAQHPQTVGQYVL